VENIFESKDKAIQWDQIIKLPSFSKLAAFVDAQPEDQIIKLPSFSKLAAFVDTQPEDQIIKLPSFSKLAAFVDAQPEDQIIKLPSFSKFWMNICWYVFDLFFSGILQQEIAF
jgi:hypothetical protein